MAKKDDWKEVLYLLETKEPKFLDRFIKSNDVFYPKNSVISAKDLSKKNPGKWVPIYKKEDVPEILHKNRIYPIRAGQGSFFFYKGDIFLDLNNIKLEKREIYNIKPIEKFLPLTLEVEFQRNENAYLNKAYALGIINDFTKEARKLLYGQFGKIKTSKDLEFKTSKGSKLIKRGFQFEIDLVLESEKNIFIFEAKLGNKERTDFVLLQLYYPLIYFYSLIGENKNIRTVFVEIIKNKNTKEIYKFIEIKFDKLNFYNIKVLQSIQYSL